MLTLYQAVSQYNSTDIWEHQSLHTFGREAAIGEAHDGLAPRLEHSVHLLEDFHRLCQVVHRDSICDDIKAVVLVWQLGVCT